MPHKNYSIKSDLPKAYLFVLYQYTVHFKEEISVFSTGSFHWKLSLDKTVLYKLHNIMLLSSTVLTMLIQLVNETTCNTNYLIGFLMPLILTLLTLQDDYLRCLHCLILHYLRNFQYRRFLMLLTILT